MPFDMEQEEYEEELRERMEYQGKTKEQVQLSEFMAGMAVLFLLCGIVFSVMIAILMWLSKMVASTERKTVWDATEKKSDYRKLWISRINAASRQHDLTYSKFINGLNNAGIKVDRKILADLAVNDPKGFKKLVDLAKKNLNA